MRCNFAGRLEQMIDHGSHIVKFFRPETDVRVIRGRELWRSVADRLRHEIFTGKQAPGERLVETRIARELGVAQSSVREALNQLENEGLVTRVANTGAFVTSLSESESDQIYILRAELEALAVELVGQRNRKEDIQKLNDLLAGCEALEAANDPDPLDVALADLQFHLGLWALSGNEFLRSVLSRLVIPLFAFETRNFVPLLSKEERIRIIERHKHVVALLSTNNIVEARRSMALLMTEFRAETRAIYRERSQGFNDRHLDDAEG
jgi:DNA-binding GntR family transcriptional regulator